MGIGQGNFQRYKDMAIYLFPPSSMHILSHIFMHIQLSKKTIDSCQMETQHTSCRYSWGEWLLFDTWIRVSCPNISWTLILYLEKHSHKTMHLYDTTVKWVILCFGSINFLFPSYLCVFIILSTQSTSLFPSFFSFKIALIVIEVKQPQSGFFFQVFYCISHLMFGSIWNDKH